MNKKPYKDTDYDIYTDGKCFSHKTNKFLKASLLNDYLSYNLTYPDGKKRRTRVHRMVAEAFIPNPENLPIVNHKDGNKRNNNIDNLEWVTVKQNTQHAVENGLKPASNQNGIFYTNKLQDEEWKEIPNFPNYRVSSCGRIMNKNTKRLLKPDSNSKYYSVNLYKNNKQYKFLIHRLVYEVFNEDKIEDGYVINHIDGNKINNCLNNLEKITRTENNLHAVYKIKTTKNTKEVSQYDLNLKLIKTYPSIAEAQRQTGINNISRAAKQHTKAGSFYWKFN